MLNALLRNKAGACMALLVLGGQAFASVPGADLLARVIMKDLDRDFDGKIDANEWKDGTLDGFVEMDRNLDNLVVGSEIKTLSEPLSNDLGKVGARICVSLIESLFMTLDKDGDHCVSKVEYEDGCAAVFKKLDTDHDGFLTNAELLELPTKLIKGGS
jgi:Ca2+-binding EF-hand superfamily protein